MSDKLCELRVTAIRWEAKDVVSVELQAPDHTPLSAFTAGSHIDLHLPGALVRSYSLLNDQRETHRYVIGVALDAKSRGGSRYVHHDLRVGALIKIGGPRNHFPVVEDAAEHVLIAGGIGVTPMLAMLRQLTYLGRKVDFYYAVRETARQAFAAEISSLCAAHFHVDAEQGAPLDIQKIVASHPNAQFYCCGPLPMLAAFEAATQSLPPEHVHVEYFTAKTPQNIGADKVFEVECRKSGKTITVTENISIADALMKAGIDVPVSCCEGICGSCETAILEGEADHRDSVLSKQEKLANKAMMICVSRAKNNRLVLDI